jgi:hypothetical protein
MKSFITALALVFALATVTSVIVLHGNHANVDQGRHTAGHQRIALLY